MRVASKVVCNIETCEVLERIEYEYHGPVALCCGASPQEKDAFSNEQAISNLLKTNLQTFAGENQSILKDITGPLAAIVAGGPSQTGLSPQAEAAERTMTAEQINSAGQNATNAVRSALASAGGGTTYLPSGSSASILGALAEDTAVKEAEAQSNITQQNYQLGRENFWAATQGLATAPGELENPVSGAGSAATGAASAEMQGGENITQASQAWMQPLGQIIGGIGGAAVTAGMKPH